MWTELLVAAKKGESYQKVFPAANYAVNMRHRFHEFRRDAIREGIPGADLLTEMPCSYIPGTDKCGLMWVYIGSKQLLEAAAALEHKHATQLPATAGPGIIQHSGVGDSSEAEKAVMAYLNRSKNPVPDMSGASADATPEDSPALDIPALDLNPQGPPLPTCPPHELDPATGTRCIKCGLPEDQWPK